MTLCGSADRSLQGTRIPLRSPSCGFDELRDDSYFHFSFGYYGKYANESTCVSVMVSKRFFNINNIVRVWAPPVTSPFAGRVGMVRLKGP